MRPHELETFYKATLDACRYEFAIAVATTDSGARTGVEGVGEAKLD
jgi:hypothetical protein